MTRAMKIFLEKTRRGLASFRSDEEGASTIEFVILFTPVFILFLMAVEVGMYSIRHVGLERGTDLAVRQIRLNAVDVSANQPGLDSFDIRDEVCRWTLLAGKFEDCVNSLKIELIRTSVDDVDGALLSESTKCINKDDPDVIEVAENIPAPVSNELMLLRVCSLYDPIFPTSGFGRTIPRQAGASDFYGLTTVSAFAVEPNE